MKSLATTEPLPLDTLLAALDEDRQRAAEILLDLRHKLTTVFESRGFSDIPELVDRTLDRAARKAAEGADLRHRPFPYIYGIARFVALEAHRQHRRREAQQEENHLLELRSTASPPQDEPRQVCFRRCMAKIPAVGRELLWSYFLPFGTWTSDPPPGDRIAQRKQLAESQGISELALRLRIHRLRAQLADCLERCLANETDSAPGDSRE